MNFKLRRLYPVGISPQVPTGHEAGWSRHYAGQKNLTPAGIGAPPSSLYSVAVLTELPGSLRN